MSYEATFKKLLRSRKRTAKSVAEAIGVSEPYISQLGTRYPLSERLMQDIAATLDLTAAEQRELYVASANNLSSVRLSVSGCSSAHKELAMRLAQTLPTLPESKVKTLLEFL